MTGNKKGSPTNGRKTLLAPSVQVQRRADGSILATSQIPLPSVEASFPLVFEKTATKHPLRIFMRQRATPCGEWQSITYDAALRAAKSIAQWFLNKGRTDTDVIAILSGQSIDHVLVMLGAQFAGVAVAPMSPGYSLLSTDFVKLTQCMKQCAAKYVFADDGKIYGSAIAALAKADPSLCLILGTNVDRHPGAVTLDDIRRTEATQQVEDATKAITLDRIGRIMFTSGSTGSPKAAPQTHDYLVTTVAQIEALELTDFGDEAPQHLESMPYSHIMAGNFNFSIVVRAGGTINLDDGKPTPQQFQRTIQNLREISPHFFITVPLGYTMLCDAMEQDTALRDSFFRNMCFLGFGGAVLPDLVAQRLRKLSVAARGYAIPLFAFYGATEYMFGAMQYWDSPSMDVIGLPPPGLTWKLIPVVDSKFELRVHGRTLMPASGYLGGEVDPSKIFDEEGCFRTGDLVRWLDPDDPRQGLMFEGRLSEEFKLATGTWVSVGPLRTAVLSACDPLLSEAVVCGLNRDWVGLLLWLNEPAARRLAGDNAANLSAVALSSHPTVTVALKEMLQKHNAAATGASLRIGRAMVMNEPLKESELSAKRTASQRLVLTERAADVVRLYETGSAPDIVDLLPGP